MASLSGKDAHGESPWAKPRLNMQARENIAGYLLISPWLFGFVALVIGPFIASFVLSLVDTDMLSRFRFVGLGNYVQLAQDELWWKSLFNTGYLAFFGVSTGFVLSLSLALLLNEQVRGIRIFRTLFYLPSVVSGVAVYIIWITIFDHQFGLLNTIVSTFGIEPQRWLTGEDLVKPSLVIMSWWGAGGPVLIYLAGLQSISQELYEAAELDGAARLQRFRYVTLPMLTPTIFFVLVTGMIGALQNFIGPLVMTEGGPRWASLTVVLYLYNNAFRYFKMGYASALAWALFVVIAAFSALLFRSSSAWVYYEGELRDS